MEDLQNAGETVLGEWIRVAHRIRTMQYVLESLPQYEVGGFTAEDDEEFRGEHFSTWALFYMSSAVEHLSLWLENSMPPVTEEDGCVGFRPLLTLGRGGLESACTAFWVLDEDASTPRHYRHIRLVVNDLEEEIKACSDAEGRRILTDLKAEYKDLLTKNGAPAGYIGPSKIIQEVAESMGGDSNVLFHMWQHASAASHSKRWLTIYDEDSALALSADNASSGDRQRMDAVSIVGAAADVLFAAMTMYVETSEIQAAALLRLSCLRSLRKLLDSPGHDEAKRAFCRSVLTGILDLPIMDSPAEAHVVSPSK